MTVAMRCQTTYYYHHQQMLGNETQNRLHESNANKYGEALAKERSIQISQHTPTQSNKIAIHTELAQEMKGIHNIEKVTTTRLSLSNGLSSLFRNFCNIFLLTNHIPICESIKNVQSLHTLHMYSHTDMRVGVMMMMMMMMMVTAGWQRESLGFLSLAYIYMVTGSNVNISVGEEKKKEQMSAID
uniref:Uncharacterized protein n=1 Tax=Glossina pallidipes TaxID=7398 RepID=A0A1A9ZRS7_GLOPL